MPIAALPQTTIRAIGSTSVISDPCSVVKELLDNALDATASSLQIEISQNTLDVIQLKDNGRGITAEDHPNVCKHAFTSKIETVDDLRNVGGTSLGFRGEALASVAEMSGDITITTRTAAEVTATSLKYGRDGELTRSTRTSHPVGTTVRITDFLKHIPVRRQTALKGSAKTLTKLKKLLQAYAFAQPSKRISLKVVKAKTESNNWQYAPGAEATLTDAALKIVGRDVASSCTLKEISPSIEDDVISDEAEYKLAALLPKEDIDIAKLNNVGQYLSVDGRPLSTQNGVGQAIAKIFKTYIRAAVSKTETSAKVTDPFCCLQLTCPKGAYDVNIEPGKDDVLFGDRDFVLSLVEKLLTEMYGPLADSQKTQSSQRKAVSPSKPHGESQFELLLSRRRPEEPLVQDPSTSREPPNSTPASPVSQKAPASSISPSPDTCSPGTENGTRHPNNRSGSCESRYVNPWSISRINASFQTPQRLRAPQSSFQSVMGGSPDMARRRDTPKRPEPPSSMESPELPSPPGSILTPGSPFSRRASIRAPRDSQGERMRSVGSSRHAARERDRERYGNGALDTWFQRTTGRSLGQDALETPSEQEEGVPSLSQLAEERFKHHPQDGQTCSSAVVNTQEDAGSLSEDESPHPAEGNVASGHRDGHEESMDSGRGFPVLEKWAASLHRDFDSANQADLERALDFEKRKKEANQRNGARLTTRETELNSPSGPPVESSPHHNRYLAAKAVLNGERPLTVESDTTPALSPHDPRAYLMRHQNDHRESAPTANGGIVKRLHTSKLPFERVPEGQDLHRICLPLPVDLTAVSTSFQLTARLDSFTQRGAETDAFSISDMSSVVPCWNHRLASIIKGQFKSKDRTELSEWQIDLAPILTRHAAQFNTS